MVISNFLWHTVILNFWWHTVISNFLWHTVISNSLWHAVISNFQCHTVISNSLWHAVSSNFVWHMVISNFWWHTVIYKFSLFHKRVFIFKMGFGMSFHFQNVVLFRKVFSFSKCERFHWFLIFFSFSRGHENWRKMKCLIL